MKHFTKRLLPILVSLSPFFAHANWSSSDATQFGPCGCVWDNTTKNYPKNSVSEGFFSTTVKYQCGYICLDANSQPVKVMGDHEVSYTGKESGDEVVCDGLFYASHENPTGEGGRWSTYMWDGVTRAFDARRSHSPTVQAWAQQSCQGLPALPRKNHFVGSKQLDQMREQIGMKPITNLSALPQEATPDTLSKEMLSLCQPDARQQAFLEKRIDQKLNPDCSKANVEVLRTALDERRQNVFKLRSSAETAEFIEDLQAILLCPALVKSLPPANLRILLDKVVHLAKQDESLHESTRSLACTMGWRGLRWGIMSPAAKKFLVP